MNNKSQNNDDVYLKDLDSVSQVSDNAIIIVEDEDNTKTMSIENLRKNIISDGESPSDSKVYSSEKIKTLLEETKNEMNDEISESNNSIENIKNNYSTIEDTDNKIKNIKDQIISRDELDKVNEALESKRDKLTTITGDDIDSSDDTKKVQLKNLSKEVLSAMTGTTPVTITQSPTGGWTTDSLADKSITSKKLSNDYRYKGRITDGNISEILEDGIYLLGSRVQGVPKYKEDDNDLKMLTVTLYGENREFIIQKVDYVYQLGDRPYFIRKGKTLNIQNYQFEAKYEISDTFKVDVKLFGDEIADRGELKEGDIFTVLKEGNYETFKEVKNLPTKDDYFVTVRKYDNYYLYEARLKSTAQCIIYSAYSYLNDHGIMMTSKWFKITGSDKSKFDNQRLHLFGDGICYGLGSTDISSKAYPYILYEKYGFKVFNHAINDATIGNYNVLNMTERSVLTQIENASFEDNDIAIIFAGTNDFKNGNCVIGDNEDKKDTTFKGSLNLAIENIFKKNISIKLLIVTPMFRSCLNSGDNRDSDENPINGRYLKQYTDAIEEIANLNHIPCKNMYDSGLVNKYNSEHWLQDGLYFNDEGHKLFATMIFDELSSLY